MDTTLSATPIGSDRDNLLSLKSDIEELISLTKESLQNLEGNDTISKNRDENSDDETEDLLDKEYALFKVCLKYDIYWQNQCIYFIIFISYDYNCKSAKKKWHWSITYHIRVCCSIFL